MTPFARRFFLAALNTRPNPTDDLDRCPPTALPPQEPTSTAAPQSRPGGPCAWCGDPRAGHGRQWSPTRGFHDWEAARRFAPEGTRS